MIDRALVADALALLALFSVGCGATSDPPAATAGSVALGATQAAPRAGGETAEADDADLALLAKGRTAVRLGDGRVLAAGGDEDMAGTEAATLFDPKTRRWSPTGAMRTVRLHHAIAALADGRALVCGGEDTKKAPNAIPAPGKVLDSCEIFDPKTSTFTPAASMHAARNRFTLTCLADGSVIAVGSPASEIFDPKTGTWSAKIATTQEYVGHTATLLQDGRVLIVGAGGQPFVSAAELYDPKTATFTAITALQQPHFDHSATLLQDGSVLIAGGQVTLGGGLPHPATFAAIFEPKHERWSITGEPHATHWKHATLLLPSGEVVVAGGPKNDPEIYSHEVWKDLPAPLAARIASVRPEPEAGPTK